MEITWYGHSCFRIANHDSKTIVTDPFDHKEVGFRQLRLKADIVTVSHDKPGHNHISAVKTEAYLIDAPGEYEIGGIFVTAIQTQMSSKRGNDEQPNLLCVIEYSGITVAHLGALNRVLTQAEVEALGTVHVVLVPVGGGDSLNSAKAAEVVSLIEPNVVIPMHYAVPESQDKLEPLKKFLKEMGLTDVEPQPSLKVKTASSLPEETRVIVLDYPRDER
jgi:L-ascorbate metabolism protein UlaG (beta-lactamase superfamily)